MPDEEEQEEKEERKGKRTCDGWMEREESKSRRIGGRDTDIKRGSDNMQSI